ncbi:hypothetical protein [Pseudomonas nunensis]|uniref:Entry exclusion lipoprotein TrbK n=1 Tax=Pseudomonas nunensis TaxID=2961896 RepID=A0ABY5EMR9_9PSED|nr:hypothetical protein [Pseudomonas nunensis]KPN90679.1 hypothetical protein AL066_10170 [Pseudomonas nunensis]MCL5228485.1 hypothetical protein [Pseudomonas nunensis]UTO16934.1 hypothetical protein NK667_11485 [Pseudomonas nunensis]
MKFDWIEWLGRGMQLALVVLAVGGIYECSADSSRKQEALCGVAQSYVEALDTRSQVSRQEIKRAEKTISDACDQNDDYRDY